MRHWSDPHRPGHLLRLQKNGLLFRTTVANTAPASVLNTADAWEAVDPLWGKTGKTTTMAFRSRVLEEQPVYYIGTDSGQVWRGSPEVGWTKLCECGSPVNAIAPDLLQNERVFVVLNRPSSPGRIKELNRLANGTWETKRYRYRLYAGTRCGPSYQRGCRSCGMGDRGTTIYVGTDQGVYRGHVDPMLVLDPFAALYLSSPRRSTIFQYSAIGRGGAHQECQMCGSRIWKPIKTSKPMTGAGSFAPAPTGAVYSS